MIAPSRQTGVEGTWERGEARLILPMFDDGNDRTCVTLTLAAIIAHEPRHACGMEPDPSPETVDCYETYGFQWLLEDGLMARCGLPRTGPGFCPRNALECDQWVIPTVKLVFAAWFWLAR